MHPADPVPLEREPLRQLYDVIASGDGATLDDLREADRPLASDAVPDAVEGLLDAGFLQERDGRLYLDVPTGAAGTDVTVRVARQDDLPAVEAVIDEVAAEKTYIEAETVAEALDRDETLLRFDEETSRVFFVAEAADEVVGWLHIEAPERAKLRHTARFTLGVAPDYRGRGIGKHLMTAGLEWAEAHGYHKVYNDFPATNRAALAFLDSLDYDAHNEAVRRDHYYVDGELVDQMSLAVYLRGTPTALTHFDRVQREAEELYQG